MWSSVLEILMRFLLVLGFLVGLIFIPLGLSGNFIILGLCVLYDAAHRFVVFGFPLLALFLGVQYRVTSEHWRKAARTGWLLLLLVLAVAYVGSAMRVMQMHSAAF